MAVGQNLAFARVDDPASYVDERRLAGAIRSQKSEDLSAFDLQVNTLERLKTRLVGFGELGYGDDRLQYQTYFLEIKFNERRVASAPGRRDTKSWLTSPAASIT